MNEDDLIDRWNAFAEARERFLEALALFTPAEAAARPGHGWSAVQVLEHVLASESGTLAYMRKKTSSGWEKLDPAAAIHLEAGDALVSRLKSTDRITAPSVLTEPAGASPLPDLLEKWEALREEMQQFVFELDEEFYYRLVFRQPVAGPLNLFHTIEFLTHHLYHHIPQLNRIYRELNP